jgi:hypothetical protein
LFFVQVRLRLPPSLGEDYKPGAELEELRKDHAGRISSMRQYGLGDVGWLQESMTESTICLACYCNEWPMQQRASAAMLRNVQLLVREYGASPSWIISDELVSLMVRCLHHLVHKWCNHPLHALCHIGYVRCIPCSNSNRSS